MLFGSASLMAQARKAKAQGADLIELRMDSLSPADRGRIADVVKDVQKASKLPILATARRPEEQGSSKGVYNISDGERVLLYSQVAPWVEMLDVEIENPAVRAVVSIAQRFGVNTVLSYHDFSSVPDLKKMKQLASKFKSLKGDIFKVAGMPKDRFGTAAFLKNCLAFHPLRRIFIAMGAAGQISRVAGFCFGSCLSYGSVSQSSAPGQIPLGDLVKLNRTFYPSK